MDDSAPVNNPPTLIINDDWKMQYEKDLEPLPAWEKKAIDAVKVQSEAPAPAPAASNQQDLSNLCDLEGGIKDFETLQEESKHDRFFRLQFNSEPLQPNNTVKVDHMYIGSKDQTVFPNNAWPNGNYEPTKDYSPSVKEKTDKGGRTVFIFDNPLAFSSMTVVVSVLGNTRFVLLNNVLLPLKDLLTLESCVESSMSSHQFESNAVVLTLADKRVFTIRGVDLRLLTDVLCHLSQRFTI
jgi:hypothetical protein